MKLIDEATLEARDKKIKVYLQSALDYMNTDDPAKGPVADMYARFIIEAFNEANTNPSLRSEST